MKNFLCTVVIASLLASCSSKGIVRMTVTQPAPVSVPAEAKRIGIINRSETNPRNRAIDVVDKIFSLEGAQLDKEGAKAGIDGLIATLQQNDRFTEVVMLNEELYVNSTAGVFPPALSWSEIEKICRRNNVDLLFSLEVFDTDSKVNYSMTTVPKTTPVGKINVPEHTATMVTNVTTGWRLYDPVSRIILDEYTLPRSISFIGKGINPAAAAAALLERKEAVKQVGNEAGTIYAERILPYRLRVVRNYFIKGNDALKTARRRAETGNWDGAAEIWEQQAHAHESKVAGRASYNMAIINEINGDLDGAIQWARKSYEDYGIKLGLNYVRILENRKIDNQILQSQAKR